MIDRTQHEAACQEVRGYLQTHGPPYLSGGVCLTQRGEQFEVVLGVGEMYKERVVYEGPDREKAVSRAAYHTYRRCTSCGQKGCHFDLLRKKTLVDTLTGVLSDGVA